MAQTTLISSDDTYIRSSVPTSNQEGAGSLFVGEYKSAVNDISHTLVKFDLSTIAGTITAATLRMKDKGTDFATNNRTMRVYRMLRSWVASQATWNVYSTGNNWGTAGAENTTSDREATDIGSVSMPGVEVAQYYDITLTASAVEQMRSGSLTNNGFLLRMDTEIDDLHDFTDNTQTDKPQLVVTYTPFEGGFIYMSV